MRTFYELLYQNFNTVILLVLMIETILVMYTVRKNKANKWYAYLIPYFKLSGRTKSTLLGYWGVVVLLEIISVCVVTDDIWAYIFTQCVMYIIIQYFVYVVIWLVRKVDEIVVYLNNKVFICFVAVSSITIFMTSIDETNKVVICCKLITLMLAVANISLTIFHLIDLVTDSSYRIDVVRRYYNSKINQNNSIIKMKLEVIFLEYIVLIGQLSIIIYLFVTLPGTYYWAQDGKAIETYWDCLYYTITTFLSIGYGDIVPVTDLGRIVDLIISFIGVIFIGCFVGLILGNDDGDFEREKKTLEKASNEDRPQKPINKKCRKQEKGVLKSKKRR